MRILGRTLIILAAALIVVGATVAVAGSEAATSRFAPPAGFRQQRPGTATGNDVARQSQNGALGAGEGPRGGERRREGGGGLFGIGEVLGQFALIAVIVAGVVLPQKLIRRFRPTPKLQRRAPPEPTISN